MRISTKIWIFLFLVCIPFTVKSQIKGVGLPFILNYERNEYKASTQNWSIAQSKRGFIYFGNNDGILEYDGTSWNIYTVPNSSIVRSLLAHGDTIFGGAFEQIGYLAPDHSGQMKWNSLNHLIPPQFSNFDEIWKIFHHEGSIIFQSFQYIFILKNNQLKVIEPLDRFSFMHSVGSDIYVVDRAQGLMLIDNDSIHLLNSDEIFLNNEITCMLPNSKGIIVGTTNEGLYLWDGSFLKPWQKEINTYLIEHNLFSGAYLNGDNYAFGSISNGVFICDSNGNILQHLNRIRGLQNNTILAIFQDRRNNLWLGLDNGIDYLEISSPLTMLNHNFNIESAYATIIHNNILYVGTNQGLFGARIEDADATSMKLPVFTLIKGTEGQVWSLKVVDNTLLCGHNYGCFQVEGFNARQIIDIRGFWSFLEPPVLEDIIIVGTYSGLVRLKKQNSSWYFLDEIEGFRESSRDMFLDKTNHIWVSHGYKGLFRLKMSEDFSKVVDVLFLYNEAGLPAALPYNIQTVSGDMYITTAEGVFKYNYTDSKFIAHEALNGLFQHKGFIDKIHQDQNGNLWYYTENYLGVMRLLEDGTFRDIIAPFSRINNFLLPAFQNIFIADPYNIFIGTQNGLAHYHPGIINDYNVADPVYFKEINFYSHSQSRSYLYDEALFNDSVVVSKVPFSLNSVQFKFTSTAFENPEALMFSHRLKGFDTKWSDWNALNFKEYTNLSDGDYTFEVKALNAFGVESTVSVFQFSIDPPFFRSKMAYSIYIVMFLLIIAGNIYFVRRRMMKIREKEKFRHEKKLARREQIFKEQSELSEKEIIQLRNERLKTEMNHKNKELANATLHLIQKNKTLTSLKNDLGKLLRNLPSDNTEKQNVNNLLKKVNKDLRNEKNWELFNNYFDDVHQDFITRMKEKHQELSPKELRLCAYLRMNLSTKEIAPLMNISIRGVEISRYRLRKKLQIEHDTNLTDYLISY